MYQRILAIAAISVMAAPAFAILQTGQMAPDFTAPASLAGKEFKFALHDALKKGPVVVYFYPAAFSGGCNLQAHTFAENYEKFSAAGATVVGVSFDGISRLNDFSADPQYCAGKLPVASDASGAIAKSFDVTVVDHFGTQSAAKMRDTRGQEIGHNFADRTTFVVGADGRIVATIGGLGGDANAMKALEIVQSLKAAT